MDAARIADGRRRRPDDSDFGGAGDGELADGVARSLASRWVQSAHPVAALLTALLVGAAFATWLAEVSIRDSRLWVDYHQATTAAYTAGVPPLGALALIATAAALAVTWRSQSRRWLVLGALGCLLAGLLVTVAVHFPMNAEIATWQPTSPPPNWEELRERWVMAHAVRSGLTVAALALVAAAGVRRSP